jgi:hypothetical protein
MAEFWEWSFQEKRMMWGEGPTLSANFARDRFVERGVKSVLLPGIGYGRNAKPFLEAGMEVAGIEISETAIELARSRLGWEMQIHHGSVSEMPFDERMYDGIFCHALIHLLDEAHREKLIQDCWAQLNRGGLMIFSAVSTRAPSFGQGKEIGANRYEQFGGVQLFFYDEGAMRKEFGGHGLIEVREMMEPSGKDGAREMPFWVAVCRKE